MHPYFPLSTPITYVVFDVTDGEFHPDTGHVDVLGMKPHANSPQVISPLPSAQLNAISQCYHRPGDPVDFAASLAVTQWGDYIGEIGTPNVWQVPPLPILLPILPRRRFMGSSLIVRDGAIHDTLNWESFLIHAGQPWGDWPDTIRTGLLEDNRDPVPQVAYNYVFARDKNGKPIGLVQFWYIAMLPGETPKGILYHATQY